MKASGIVGDVASLLILNIVCLKERTETYKSPRLKVVSYERTTSALFISSNLLSSFNKSLATDL